MRTTRNMAHTKMTNVVQMTSQRLQSIYSLQEGVRAPPWAPREP
jgi:hypothetical protein